MFSDGLMQRQYRALTALRWVLAILVAIHGWYRCLSGGYQPFGEYLESVGWPFGLPLAIAITGFEMVAAPLFALGRWILPLSVAFVCLYTAGIIMVHAPAGWFVVGAGRNGVEYSVLLIAGFLLCAYARPTKTG